MNSFFFQTDNLSRVQNKWARPGKIKKKKKNTMGLIKSYYLFLFFFDSWYTDYNGLIGRKIIYDKKSALKSSNYNTDFHLDHITKFN